VLYGTGPFLEGNVVDFIDFDLFTVNFGGGSFRFWPIFNIADMSVSIGVILLLLASRTVHKEEPDPVPVTDASGRNTPQNEFEPTGETAETGLQ
jgi:Signal peptidase (SPase) II